MKHCYVCQFSSFFEHFHVYAESYSFDFNSYTNKFDRLYFWNDGDIVCSVECLYLSSFEELTDEGNILKLEIPA